MTHDPLCMDHGLIDLSTYDCTCDEIAKVRQDERAACIKAIRSRRDDLVEQITPRPAGPVGTKQLANAIYEDAIAALRALQDRP